MPKILVVDDAAYVRLRLSRLLSSNGYDVIEAGDGKAAVAQYEAEKPDGVLLDIIMPEMDGMAALKELRKLDDSARVVMLTSVHEQSTVMEAIRSGALDFVVKPFDEQRLLAVVEKMVGVS
jgi:two-component system, chemotaxis family, chemotaxis protein CheY